MKKIGITTLIFICLILLLFTNCKSDLEQQILDFAQDKSIDQKEYESITKTIASSTDREYAKFKTKGVVDNQKVVKYIVGICKEDGFTIQIDEIWQPNLTKEKIKFNINVFVENSGSMNGYLDDPNTQFKNSVYSLLSRLKLFVDDDSLNLYFVNSNDKLLYMNASVSDIEMFKDILNPTQFQHLAHQMHASLGSTDLNDLVKRSINKVDKNNLSVFISDCIYSPGRGIDANQFLADQKNGVFLNFASELKKRSLAIILLQVKGNFKGTYFDHNNNRIPILANIERPFYIWFIGTDRQIEAISNSKMIEQIEGGYSHKLAIQRISDLPDLKFKIQPNPKIGSFSNHQIGNLIIEDARIEKDGNNKGYFGFNIAVDFSNSIQDREFFLDKTNYSISNSQYNYEIEETNKIPGYTHIIRFKTNQLVEEDLQLSIIGKCPSWVINSSSTNDSQIASDSDEQSKTFGLKFLVEGVCDAFYRTSDSDIINSFKITIKK